MLNLKSDHDFTEKSITFPVKSTFFLYSVEKYHKSAHAKKIREINCSKNVDLTENVDFSVEIVIAAQCTAVWKNEKFS